MTVNITFSGSAAGSSLADTVDLSTSVAPGSATDYQDVYISHDGNLSITDCELALTRYVGSNYLNEDEEANLDEDLVELLGWGAGNTEGIRFVMDGWDTWTSGENGVDSGTGTWISFRTGTGDVDNPITLSEDAITTGTPGATGEIPAGAEAHIQIKAVVPSSVTRGAGYRAANILFSYSATS